MCKFRQNTASILEKKMLLKLKLSKSIVQWKQFGKILIIFDIENSLWKSKFYNFLHHLLNWMQDLQRALSVKEDPVKCLIVCKKSWVKLVNLLLKIIHNIMRTNQRLSKTTLDMPKWLACYFSLTWNLVRPTDPTGFWFRRRSYVH